MQQAVNGFFAAQLDAAIQKLDQAWLETNPIESQNLRELIQEAGWFLRVGPLLVDSQANTIALKLEPIPIRAQKEPAAQAALEIRLDIVDRAGKVIRSREWAAEAVDQTVLWQIDPLPEADYRVSAKIRHGARVLDLVANSISSVDQMASRLERLRKWKELQKGKPSSSEKATSVQLANNILAAADGRLAESDLPIWQMLSNWEYLVTDNSSIKQLLENSSGDSIWLQLVLGKAQQTVRLSTACRPEPMPLVIAFHGAGGSENMFFETYGAGRLIELCRERGWIVVAPRQGIGGLAMGIDKMIEMLAEQMPIDRSRVLLIGHSMGAAQAIQQVSTYPKNVRAVAAIGGGGQPTPSDALVTIPFFVAAGEKDFGLPRAKALATTLRALGATVDYQEVKEVEHMVIVQAVLDDVMRFFDTKIQ